MSRESDIKISTKNALDLKEQWKIVAKIKVYDEILRATDIKGLRSKLGVLQQEYAAVFAKYEENYAIQRKWMNALDDCELEILQRQEVFQTRQLELEAERKELEKRIDKQGETKQSVLRRAELDENAEINKRYADHTTLLQRRCKTVVQHIAHFKNLRETFEKPRLYSLTAKIEPIKTEMAQYQALFDKRKHLIAFLEANNEGSK